MVWATIPNRLLHRNDPDGIPVGVVVVDDSEHGFTDRSEFHDPLLGTSACQTKVMKTAVTQGPFEA